MHNKRRNRQLFEKASQQHGLISREQAVDLKFSGSAIDRRIQSGHWMAIRPAVYRVGAVASSWHQELMAACLWVGPEAVASHTSAAGLLKLDGVPSRICGSVDFPPLADGSLAKDAHQLIDQGAHARSALYVGVDNEPDVERVGRLAGEAPL